MIRDFMQTGQGIPKGGIPIPSGSPSSPIVRPAPVGATLTLDPTAVTLPAVWTGGGLGPAHTRRADATWCRCCTRMRRWR